MNTKSTHVSGKPCQAELEAARPLQTENHVDNYNLDVKQMEDKVSNLLDLSGLRRDSKEQQIRLLLQHLYTAVAMYEKTSDVEKVLIAGMQKKLRNFFDVRCTLKERKRKKGKALFPPAPLSKESTKIAKADKILYFAERRDAFRQECLKYVGIYDDQRLADFYNYWSEANARTGKMRFEGKRYWDLDSRIKRWMNNSYTSDNTAATIRLERTKKRTKQDTASVKEQQQQAAIREQDNIRLEKEIERRKESMMRSSDYTASRPDGILAQIERARKAREAKEAEKAKGQNAQGQSSILQ